MTLIETAGVMRRLADVLEKTARKVGNTRTPFAKGGMSEEAAIGAAGMICYLRDLFTMSPREEYRREDILVLLELVSSDNEIFPCGIGRLFWDLGKASAAASTND